VGANLCRQLAPPKAKYVQHILQATHTGEAGVAEIFRGLQPRLRDPTWTIAFKALIIVHLMIRDGEVNVTLSFLSNSLQRLVGMATYTEGTWLNIYLGAIVAVP